MGTPGKINAILLNIKINQRELANMCRYKLATYWQNFMEIYLTGVKILQKVLGGGLLFLTHTVDNFQLHRFTMRENIAKSFSLGDFILLTLYIFHT